MCGPRSSEFYPRCSVDMVPCWWREARCRGQTHRTRRQKDIIRRSKQNNGQICRKEAGPREKVHERIYAAVTVSGLGQAGDDDDDAAADALSRSHHDHFTGSATSTLSLACVCLTCKFTGHACASKSKGIIWKTCKGMLDIQLMVEEVTLHSFKFTSLDFITFQLRLYANLFK